MRCNGIQDRNMLDWSNFTLPPLLAQAEKPTTLPGRHVSKSTLSHTFFYLVEKSFEKRWVSWKGVIPFRATGLSIDWLVWSK